MFGQPVQNGGAPISAVGENYRWRVRVVLITDEHFEATTQVMLVGRMNMAGDQQPENVDENVPLAARDLLAAVESTDPPFSVVFVD